MGTASRTDTSPRVLVTRRLPAAVLSRLEHAARVDVYTGEGAMPIGDLRARVANADALVSMVTDAIGRDILDAGARLKIVANVAVGYNNIDVAHARSRGILVTNTPDVLTDATADFTWALILAITRRVSEGERLLRRGEWKGWALDFMLGPELRGKQLGIVGFGRIGQAVAARAAAFGMRVAYTARRPGVVPELHSHGTAGGPVDAEEMSLDRLLNTSDIVSLHVPLTEDTRHLIGKRALARMKRSAYLVNASRGPVVDEAALAWALGQHLIAGAALDVYEHEPSINPDLLTLETVLLAPHLGSATTETRTAMSNLAVDNVLAVLEGRPPLTAVSPMNS